MLVSKDAKYLIMSGKPLRVSNTTHSKEILYDRQGNDLAHSNNVENWAIRG
jgi:hypothetical protein